MSVQEKSRVLTHLGYAVRKGWFSAEQLQTIQTELTVSPRVAGGNRFAKPAPPFTVYMESPTRYYLPRFWAEKQYGPAEASILKEGTPLRGDLEFVGKPYEYQKEIIEKCVANGYCGLLSVPCGRGKTFMAIAIAYRLRRRFLVVVDKEFLLQQWSGELKSLLPGIRIGILQGPKCEVGEEYDVTICMLQTLCQRDFPTTLFPTYGMTIFDECHHLGAAHFSRALLKLQTKYMIGLSATPTRDDGLTKVFEWFLGKPFYWEKVRKADPGVIVRRVPFSSDAPEYTHEPTDYRGEIVTARLLTQIVEFAPRNARILELLRELVENEHRKILVLSERVAHLRVLEEGLKKTHPNVEIGYYIGGMKEAIREEGAKKAKVLLATYQMASEAMNIKALNAVIMASPRKKIEQSTGRILRTRAEDRQVAPLILDVVDSHDCYERRWRKRLEYYKKCGYTMEGIGEVGDDEGNEETSSEEEEVEEKVSRKKRVAAQASACLIVDE